MAKSRTRLVPLSNGLMFGYRECDTQITSTTKDKKPVKVQKVHVLYPVGLSWEDFGCDPQDQSGVPSELRTSFREAVKMTDHRSFVCKSEVNLSKLMAIRETTAQMIGMSSLKEAPNFALVATAVHKLLGFYGRGQTAGSERLAMNKSLIKYISTSTVASRMLETGAQPEELLNLALSAHMNSQARIGRVYTQIEIVAVRATLDALWTVGAFKEFNQYVRKLVARS